VTSGRTIRGGAREGAAGERDREKGARSLDVGEPDDPGVQGPLTKGPCLVKVDRYGSVSGLVRVRTPLGFIVLEYPTQEDFLGS